MTFKAMVYLEKLNRTLEKLMPLLTPASVILGILLTSWLIPYSYLVPWIFALMTFAGSLGSNFKAVQRAITRPAQILVALFLLHVLIPLLALGFGQAFFTGDSFTITGLILAVVIPTGITSFIWTANHQGNVALAFSIILTDALLSPLIVPYSLSLLVGAKIQMNVLAIVQGLLWMIVLPSLAGMLLNQLTAGKIKEQWGTPLAPFSKLGLGAVMAINSAAIAPYLKTFDWKLLLMILVVLLIASLGYLAGYLSGKLLKWEREVRVTLAFCAGMRNISTGAVLAITYFPVPVAVPVVIAMLFQQLLAALCGYFLQRYDPDRLTKAAGR